MAGSFIGVMRRLQGEPALDDEEIERRARAKEQDLIDRFIMPDLMVEAIRDGRIVIPEFSVGIVGGGFAGVAAAWYLTQCGVRVTLYEGSDRLGGRVLTNSGFIPSRIVEDGAELIGTNHPMWRLLARRNRLTLDPLTDDDAYEARGLKVRLRLGSRTLFKPDIDRIDAALLPKLDIIGSEARPVDPRRPWTSPRARTFDGTTVRERFDMPDMFGTTLPHSDARLVLETVIASDNCAPVTHQSYLGLLAAVSGGRLGNDVEGMRGYWDFTETHRCRGGNQQLATLLGATVGDVRRSTIIELIDITTEMSGAAVRITDNAAVADDFDFAILATPPTVWNLVTVRPAFSAPARTIQHGPGVKFVGHYRTKFWETARPLPLAPSAFWDELGVVWENTDNQTGTNTDAGLTVFSGNGLVLRGGAADYRAKMATFFGGTPVAQRLVDWPTFPLIETGYSVPGRDEVRRIAPNFLIPHLGRLFFAGEQTSPGFFGYMEGALQSGGRAARDVIMRAAGLGPARGRIPVPAPAPPVTPPSPPPPTQSPSPLGTPPFAPGRRGAQLMRIRGADYAVIRVSEFFPGAGPAIDELAAALHLQSDVVLHCLLGYRSNAKAVSGLFREVFPDDAVPALEEARRRLRIEATAFTANARFPEGTETPYLAWHVNPDEDEPIVLPLSDGFRSVLDEGTRQRARQTRLATVGPAFDALAAELPPIREEAVALDSDTGIAQTLSEGHSQDVAILEALDGMLGALLATPKEPPAAGDRRGVEELRTQLATLRSEAHRHMLLEPADAFRGGIVARRAATAARLRAMVEAPEFVEHVRALADNRDIAPPELYRDTIDTVSFAFQVLLASPESDRVLDAHVRPMIDALASRPIDLNGLAATVNPELDAAIRDVPAAPPASSVLVILVGVSGVFPVTFGNYPGPNTLAVGILQWAAPHLLAAVASDRGLATPLAGRLYRALVTCASVGAAPNGAGPPRPLSLAERVALLEAIDQGNLRRLRDIDWSARFQSSPAWGAAIAVASAICLYAAIQSDDASTLRRWSNILGSASGTALGVAVAVGRYSALVQAGIVRGIGGRALGVVGGAAALVSGVVTAEEEYRSGDTVGMWVGIGTATGGVLSVAGFLLAAGAGTTSTVAGAPVGVVLMVAGAALGIGAGIVSLVRSVTTEGSQLVFEAMLAHFGRASGPFADAAAERPSLQAAFDAVQSRQHSVDFWDVHPDRVPELSDLGFGADHIVLLVDESDAEVRHRLSIARPTEAVAVP